MTICSLNTILELRQTGAISISLGVTYGRVTIQNNVIYVHFRPLLHSITVNDVKDIPRSFDLFLEILEGEFWGIFSFTRLCLYASIHFRYTGQVCPTYVHPFGISDYMDTTILCSINALNIYPSISESIRECTINMKNVD